MQGADAPDGIVLSSTMLIDDKNPPVSAMALDKIRIPVLVEQHQQDACKHCAPTQMPALMSKLVNAPRKELLMFKGGESRGDSCEAMAYHGFNGIEPEVVNKTVAWIRDK